ncbi:hypothetical protein ACFLSE_06640 [Bacteroidota bacterium]
MSNELNNKYEYANQLLSRGLTDQGINIKKTIGLQGHVESQRDLGIAHMEGNYGLEKNLHEALIWFQRAIESKDPISFYKMGCIFIDENNGVEPQIELAIRCFGLSANLENVDAQRQMAGMYSLGQYLKKDPEKAKEYYKKAYNQGDKHSSFILGTCNLYDSDGSFKDFKKSKELFESSYGSEFDKEAKTLVELISKSQPKKETNKTWELRELLTKLNEEHKENYYYRGQISYYGKPLRPSMYRYPASKHPILYEGDKRLKGIGKSFYFEDSLRSNVSKAYKIKRLMSRYINNALGYTFTQSMFQQAGYTSEGLDITTDLNIALFFATYDYNNETGTYYVNEEKEYSVLYRWKNLKSSTPKDELQKDYYNCSNLISTYDIYKSFDVCDTNEEFYNSLKEYAKSINWGPEFDLDRIYSSRPFHLIKLPKNLISISRIIKQKAALLFSDCIISEPMAQMLSSQGYSPPVHMRNLPYKLVQDLSEVGFCDTFIYKRDNKLAKEILDKYNFTPEELYNEEAEDLSHLLLYGWVENLYKTLYTIGTNPFELSPPIPQYALSYKEILSTLNEWQKKKKKAGYYFEQ